MMPLFSTCHMSHRRRGEAGVHKQLSEIVRPSLKLTAGRSANTGRPLEGRFTCSEMQFDQFGINHVDCTYVSRASAPRDPLAVLSVAGVLAASPAKAATYSVSFHQWRRGFCRRTDHVHYWSVAIDCISDRMLNSLPTTSTHRERALTS